MRTSWVHPQNILCGAASKKLQNKRSFTISRAFAANFGKVGANLQAFLFCCFFRSAPELGACVYVGTQSSAYSGASGTFRTHPPIRVGVGRKQQTEPNEPWPLRALAKENGGVDGSRPNDCARKPTRPQSMRDGRRACGEARRRLGFL